jgi:hypothetical protein
MAITEDLLADLDDALARETLREVAERAGLHWTTVGRYARRERTELTLADAESLAKALGKRIRYGGAV